VGVFVPDLCFHRDNSACSGVQSLDIVDKFHIRPDIFSAGVNAVVFVLFFFLYFPEPFPNALFNGLFDFPNQGAVIAAGVFVMEMLSVMLQVWYFRRTDGKRIFRCAPIHHHFHLADWSENTCGGLGSS
jgi:hypothetical protein